MTSDELPDEVIREAKKQIESFKFELLWTKAVFNPLFLLNVVPLPFLYKEDLK